MIDDALLVRRIYETACDETPWADLMQSLATAFHAHSVQLFTPALPESDTNYVRQLVGLDDERIRQYLLEALEGDLWYLAMVRRYGPLKTGFTRRRSAPVRPRMVENPIRAANRTPSRSPTMPGDGSAHR